MTPRTVVHQALLTMELSRQGYWSEYPFPSPGNLPQTGIEPRSPALQEDSLLSRPPVKSMEFDVVFNKLTDFLVFKILFSMLIGTHTQFYVCVCIYIYMYINVCTLFLLSYFSWIPFSLLFFPSTHISLPPYPQGKHVNHSICSYSNFFGAHIIVYTHMCLK